MTSTAKLRTEFHCPKLTALGLQSFVHELHDIQEPAVETGAQHESASRPLARSKQLQVWSLLSNPTEHTVCSNTVQMPLTVQQATVMPRGARKNIEQAMIPEDVRTGCSDDRPDMQHPEECSISH